MIRHRIIAAVFDLPGQLLFPYETDDALLLDMAMWALQRFDLVILNSQVKTVILDEAADLDRVQASRKRIAAMLIEHET